MLEHDDLRVLCHGLVSAAYVDQGVQELQTLSKGAKALLSTRRLPEEGWSEAAIERLLADLASMDSNNFESNAGVGEREGRLVRLPTSLMVALSCNRGAAREHAPAHCAHIACNCASRGLRASEASQSTTHHLRKYH